jgi:hypothetical protein
MSELVKTTSGIIEVLRPSSRQTVEEYCAPDGPSLLTNQTSTMVIVPFYPLVQTECAKSDDFDLYL